MIHISQKRILSIGVTGVFLTTLMHFSTILDLWLQGYFFKDGRWMIDENAEPLRTILYRSPKIALVATIGLTIVLAIRNWKSPSKKYTTLAALAYLAFLPVYINAIKSSIPQACPKDLARFGGHITASVWTQLQNPEKCFPGAHVSTAVAWLGLWFLLEKDLHRKCFLFAFPAYFLIISFYQTAKGAHFVSDNLATLSLGILLFTLVRKIFLSRAFTTQNR